MAQQETGLGWSAKDNWLTSNSGILLNFKQFGGSEFPGQPLPIITTLNDLHLSGLYIGSVDWGGTYGDYYVGILNYEGRYSDCVAFGVRTTTNHYDVYWASAVSGPYSVLSHTYQQDGAWSTFWGNAWSGATNYNSQTGLYYGKSSWGSNMIPRLTPQIPIFNSLQNGLDAIQILTTPIYKLYPGFSVATLTRWYSPEGLETVSPVLISSTREFALLSTDGETESEEQSTLSFLKDGVTFYMSFIPNLPGNPSDLNIIDSSLLQFGAAYPEKVFKLLADESFSNIIITDSPDPYQEGDGSGEGGADGEEDEEDDIDLTDPPSTSIGATGFITIFCPSLTELRALATFMWSSFDVDNWRKLFANPMDAILGLHIIPVPANITGTKAVKVGGIDTTIDMSYTTIRYIRRPMGTCEIPKKWGAYLDYNPYTKVSIFLPYIGFRELDTDDVMGKTVTLQYIIDILTGACVAELKCGDTVLYSWQGNCANEVPISGSDWRNAVSSALGIAATVAATVATGGASAPMIAGTVASVGANSLNLKPTINRSGSLSGSAGFIGNQRPYIIRSVPNLVIPADQNKFIGYPSFITTSLGSLTGYNEIASIHLEGIPATGNELAEIETLLKGGVIL